MVISSYLDFSILKGIANHQKAKLWYMSVHTIMVWSLLYFH